jgi:hypothetical protein
MIRLKSVKLQVDGEIAVANNAHKAVLSMPAVSVGGMLYVVEDVVFSASGEYKESLINTLCSLRAIENMPVAIGAINAAGYAYDDEHQLLMAAMTVLEQTLKVYTAVISETSSKQHDTPDYIG